MSTSFKKIAIVPVVLAVLATLIVGAASPAKADLGPANPPAPNLNHGCELKPMPNMFGNFSPVPSGSPDCTWFQSTPANLGSQITGFVPANGAITSVRIRTGANPAPLRFSVIQTIHSPLTATGARIPGVTNSACCFGRQQTGFIRLPANRTTTIPLNFRVQNYVDRANRQAVADMIAITARSGTGNLPVRVNGAPNTANILAPGNTNVGLLYPGIAPGQIRTQSTGMPQAMLTARFSFCSSGTARSSVDSVARGDKTGKLRVSSRSGVQTRATRSCRPTATSARPQVRSGSARVVVACHGSRACKGAVTIRNRSGRKAVIGKRKINLKAGQTRTIAVKLNSAARKTIKRKKRLNARIQISASKLPSSSRNVTLVR